MKREKGGMVRLLIFCSRLADNQNSHVEYVNENNSNRIGYRKKKAVPDQIDRRRCKMIRRRRPKKTPKKKARRREETE